MGKPPGRSFTFTARLERPKGHFLFTVLIPAPVSRAAGKRGPVPVRATVNRLVEVRASMVPCGGGRHRLSLNARVRREAQLEVGDPAAIVLRIDENPVADPMPRDLASALRRLDVFEAFERMPVGRRNHIIHYVEEAVAETTREKRIDMAVEVAMRASEKEYDRAARDAKKRAEGQGDDR